MRSDLALFDMEPVTAEPDPAEGLGVDARRTLRQRQLLEAGRHPNTRALLHEQAAPVDDRKAPGLRCRDCKFLEGFGHKNRAYSKCMHSFGKGYTHSAASDLRGWWPACVHFEPKDAAS